MSIRLAPIATIAATTLLIGSAALAGPVSPPGSVHVRGTVHSLKGNLLTVQTASGPVKVQLPAKLTVMSVIPSDRSQIKDGSFLGIASVPGASGAQQAREVVVFPEAARGTGEGSYPWDLPGTGKSGSKMTNGTVGHSKMTNGAVSHSRMTNGTAHSTAGGTTVTLQYKDKSGKGTGSQTITLPPGIPVVTFVPGQTSLLTPGAHVVVFCHHQTDTITLADRILVGKDGLVPPM